MNERMNVSEIIKLFTKIYRVHVTLNTSPSVIVYRACARVHTKYEMPSFTHSKDIKTGYVTFTTPVRGGLLYHG